MGHDWRWVASHVSEIVDTNRQHGKDNWRGKWLQVLHSQRVQVVLGLLLLLDILAVVTELVLDAEYPPCRIIMDHCEAIPEIAVQLEGVERRLVECTDLPEWLEEWHYNLYQISLAILVVFMLELIGLFLALGCRFFSNPLYIIDSSIIGLSLYIEYTFKNSDPVERDAFEALIFVRLWRFVRIGHGFFEDTKRLDAHRIAQQQATIEELQNENSHLRLLLARQQRQFLSIGKSSFEHQPLLQKAMSESTVL